MQIRTTKPHILQYRLAWIFQSWEDAPKPTQISTRPNHSRRQLLAKAAIAARQLLLSERPALSAARGQPFGFAVGIGFDGGRGWYRSMLGRSGVGSNFVDILFSMKR